MRRRWHALTVSAGNVILRVAERTLGASTPVRLMRGFAVVHYGSKAVDAEVFGKVSEALTLIAETDLRRYARMQTDLRQIVVMELSGALAAYIQKSGTCYLRTDIVLAGSVVGTAILLVHEATHARLDRAGVKQWPDRRARFERTCARQEAVFANRLSRERFPSIDEWIAKHSDGSTLAYDVVFAGS